MKNDNNQQHTAHFLPLFMCSGLSVGMVIGSACGNIPIGMCIGLGVGMCLGAAIDHLKRDDESDSDKDGDNKE